MKVSSLSFPILLLAFLTGCGDSSSHSLRVTTESLSAGVRGESYGPARLSAEGGDPPYSWEVAEGSLPPGLLLDAGTGRISGTPTSVEGYTFTIRLRDDIGRTAVAPFRIAIHSEFVIVRDGRFSLMGENWFPYGVNYWPHYGVNPPPASGYDSPAPEYWMGSANYDATVIEEDLVAMESMGINCLSTQASLDSDTWENLRDFLDRCLNHNIRVFLAFPKANPWKPEFDGIDPESILDEIVPALDLQDHRAIFAYDIAWEPYLGLWGERRWRLDGIWSGFIAKEYGSIAAAEIALGAPLAVSRSGHGAGIVSHNIPVRAVAGEAYACQVTMRNMGDVPWTVAPPNGFYLGKVLGEGIDDWGPLSADVDPGDDAAFDLTYTAPSAPGRYRLTLSLVQANVTWFGPLLEWEIEVVPAGAPVQEIVSYPAPVLGAEDDDLGSTTANNPAFAFRRCVDLETSARFSRVIRRIRQIDPNHLISCRQGWGGNGSDPHARYYPLELYATAPHLDFLSPENYEFMDFLESDTILGAMAAIEAYCRWASDGHPVFWAEAAFTPMNDPDEAHLDKQAAYFGLFISHMLSTLADGVTFWWWPGGTRLDEDSDFGVTNADRTPRPAAEAMAARSAEATAERATPSATTLGIVDLFTDPRGFPGIYEAHRSAALAAAQAGRRYVMVGDGEGTMSEEAPVTIGGMPKHLWAEIDKVELKAGSGDWFAVRDGMAYVVPADTPIRARAEVVNMGDAVWMAQGSVEQGAVAFAGNENHGLEFRLFLTSPVPRMTTVAIAEFVMTSGISSESVVQFQMVAEDVAWMTGSLRVRLIPAP
ncbi:MAG: hypothetical protein A2Z34_05820 [Planctomycetes bacterium RBG_16_59_8]|nr:MAG: hypothetical protein A2Z34_05820 [Planctomycetes bacterium RBG_16_59_8]